MNSGGLYIGTAGWSYADWKGIVYPSPEPPGFHPLDLLQRWFNTVEINASFYRPPVAKHAVSWVRRVEAHPDFQFTAKLWQRFTHQRDSWPSDAEFRQFTEGIAPLRDAGRLGALLAQFPWSFKRTAENRKWLARIAETFADYPLVVELRHTSWDREEVYAGFRERGIAFCNIDQPVIGESIGPSAHSTAPLSYVRFHGRNYDNWFREDAGQNERYDYLYSEEELKPWLARLRHLQAESKSLYAVTNNHFQGQAVANALEIRAALRGDKLPVPPSLQDAYPRLKAIAGAGG